MIIGISGKARVGKDTVANVFVKHGWKKMCLADEVKQIAKKLFFWNDRKDESGRQLLIDIGLKMREININAWINALHNNMLNCPIMDRGKFIVISDVRYRNEADWIKMNGGILIRVIRPTLPNAEANWRNSESETDLDDWDGWNYIITEDDYDILKIKAEEVYMKIKRRISDENKNIIEQTKTIES